MFGNNYEKLIRKEIKKLRLLQQQKILDLLIDKETVDLNYVSLYQDLLNLVVASEGVINEDGLIIQDEGLLYEIYIKILIKSRKYPNKKEIRKAANKVLELNPQDSKEIVDLINSNNNKETLDEKINFLLNQIIKNNKNKTLVKKS